MPKELVSINTAPEETYLDWRAATTLKTLPNVGRGTQNDEKWEKWVWNFIVLRLPLFTDAQLSRCSWPSDKWEKIVQSELVVSGPSKAFQINERLPQVWQEIFMKHSWETAPYHCNPLAMPSIRQAPTLQQRWPCSAASAGFLHYPSLQSFGLHSSFFNPHLKRQCVGFYTIKFPIPQPFGCTQKHWWSENEWEREN